MNRLHRRELFFLVLVLVPLLGCLGQGRPSTHSLCFGLGGTNTLDTYLSPLEYTGTQLHVVRETIRNTKWGGRNRWFVFCTTSGDVAYTKSPTDDGKRISGNIDWRIGWLYSWNVAKGLTMLSGARTDLNGGFTYSTRGGNNPAQARLSLEILLSGMAVYKFNLFGKELSARYQVDIPTIGLMFSPQYGQSYYEMFSLGNYDHNICFTQPGNAPSLLQTLSIDIPISRSSIRIGYQCNIRQSNVNDIKKHQWDNAFIVGYVKHFYLSDNKSNSRDFIY